VPTPWLDGKHTVFGEVVSDADQKIVNQIAQGDKIISVTIEGDVSELMENVSLMIEKWNAILDENFPKLPKVSKA
jgi:peptidyl-prolyl cis-trans isomerase B (cyclophilin B)